MHLHLLYVHTVLREHVPALASHHLSITQGWPSLSSYKHDHIWVVSTGSICIAI